VLSSFIIIMMYLVCVFPDLQRIYWCSKRLFPGRDVETRLGVDGGTQESVQDHIVDYERFKETCLYFSF